MAPKKARKNVGAVKKPHPKRIKLAEDSDDAVQTAMESFQTKITDVNVDCLEKIFCYLKFDDLLNVAQSNKWLRNGARLAFKHLYKTQVILNAWSTGGGVLRITDLKTCFRVLKSFGGQISNLKIIYHDISRLNRITLDQYIVKRCAATLEEIHIWNGDDKTFKDFKKPFKNVERVFIWDGSWLNRMPQLRKLFPKMIYLDLCLFRKTDDRLDCIGQMIQKNRQLQYLKLGKLWDVKVLERVSKLPNLETLSLYWDNEPRGFDDNIKFSFENVTSFELHSDSYLNVKWPKEMIAMKFNQLEELTLINVELTKDLEFFRIHPMIKTLIIYSQNNQQLILNGSELLQLKEAMPSLDELQLDGHELITIEQTILITRVLTQLKKFTFQLCHVSEGNIIKTDLDENNPKLDNLLARLRNEWTVSIEKRNGNSFIKLQR